MDYGGHDDGFTGMEIDLSASEPYAKGYGLMDTVLFSDTLSNINEVWGSEHNDSITGDNSNNFLYGGNGDDTLAGKAGTNTLEGGPGNDEFWFTSFTAPDGPDTVTDFMVTSAGDNDKLVFDERGLDFDVKGETAYSNSTNSDNPVVNQIIGLTNTMTTVSEDWSNVVDVINEGVDAGQGDGTNDGTYIVISNGTHSRVYFWEGDTNPDAENSVVDRVDEYELTHFADLENVTDQDISALTENHFDIIPDSGGV
jgi:hypothetical protein